MPDIVTARQTRVTGLEALERSLGFENWADFQRQADEFEFCEAEEEVLRVRTDAITMSVLQFIFQVPDFDPFKSKLEFLYGTGAPCGATASEEGALICRYPFVDGDPI